MASSLPPTPRSSASASAVRPGGPVPPEHLSIAHSCPSSAIPSPAPPTEASLLTSSSAPGSVTGTRDEPDRTIVEALSGSKDRLFVLKLGEDFDSLFNERGSTPGKRFTYAPQTTFQRMLVHRCAQYYKLAIENDTKAISVMMGPESRVPKPRISEIVPIEQTPPPAFKIMRRNADERARAKQPGRTDSTEDDQGDGTPPTEEPKRRPQMTIEERAAAYEQARSRIFEGFQEKEVQPSPPPIRRDSGNSEPRWADKQRRSDFSSSRGSPIPQDMTTVPASYYPPMLFNPNASSTPVHLPQQYGPTMGQPVQYMYGPQAYYPVYGYYPQSQYDPGQGPVPAMQMGYGPPPQGASFPFPQHAVTWPQIQPPMQLQPQPMHASPETQRHAFPPMTHPPPQPNRQVPLMQGHMHISPQLPSDPFPPHQYMQSYQYGGFMHQPVLVPTPPDAPGSGHSSRSDSRNGHGNGHGSNGSNGGTKGPRSSVGASYSTSTFATPMRNVSGTSRRLSTSSGSTSAHSGSGGGVGSGSRTPADETASIASSTSSSSSRRTYTSTSTTSKHPLPPRPDWAVGLMPDSSLPRPTSTNPNDSRLRMTSRTSSSNQVSRTGPVKLGLAANTTDFPPLNGNGNSHLNGANGIVSNGVRAGAWSREGTPASLFGSGMAPGGNSAGSGVNMNAVNSSGGLNVHRFEEIDSIGRPPPKSFGLYNPNTGMGPAALPVQVRGVQEGGSQAAQQGNGAGNGVTIGDTLAEQISKLSVADGGKVAGSA